MGSSDPLSRRPLIVCHIGPHKTGSTAFQHQAVANRGELARIGVRYPRLFQERYVGHHNLVNALASRAAPTMRIKPATAVDLLLSTRMPSLVSSENFAEDAVALERLAQQVTDRQGQLRFVFCVRDRAEVMLSRWKQHVKIGVYLEPFHVYARELIEPGPPTSVRHQVDYLRDLIGANTELQLMDYRAARKSPWSQLEIVVKAGFEIQDLPTLKRARQANVSLSESHMELFRLINRQAVADNSALSGSDLYLRYAAAMRRNLEPASSLIQAELESATAEPDSVFDQIRQNTDPDEARVRQDLHAHFVPGSAPDPARFGRSDRSTRPKIGGERVAEILAALLRPEVKPHQ